MTLSLPGPSGPRPFPLPSSTRRSLVPIIHQEANIFARLTAVVGERASQLFFFVFFVAVEMIPARLSKKITLSQRELALSQIDTNIFRHNRDSGGF